MEEFEGYNEDNLCEKVFALALMALLKPNLDPFERPNSGVIVHSDDVSYIVNFDGEQLKMIRYTDPDNPIRSAPHGQMVVLESSEN